MSHSIISSPEALTNPIPRTSIITYITMVRPVDQAKLKKLISFIRLVPHLSLPDAMKMAKCSLQRVLLRHLPGHSLVAFREILTGKGAPPRNHDERLKKQRKQGAIERTPPPERTPPLSIKPHCRSSLLLVDVKSENRRSDDDATCSSPNHSSYACDATRCDATRHDAT